MKTNVNLSRANTRMKKYILISLLAVLSLAATAIAAPIRGKVFKFRQPDGSKVAVKVWGDEFYQRVESLDGYTLIRNGQGWIRYAELSGDDSEFVPTDAIYSGTKIDKHPKAKKLKAMAGFRKKLKLSFLCSLRAIITG